MISPFPGMDPYLERRWGDVHASLVIYSRDSIQAALPAGLFARAEERVFLETPESRGRNFFPDVRVVEYPRRGRPAAVARGGIAVAEPVVIHLREEPETQTFIEIRDARSGNRVITVVEVLSPSNKAPGEGQDLYLRKQRELRKGGVSSVEIDLLRDGRRILAVPPEQIPPSHRTTYQICVRRSWRPDEVEVYRAPIRERLPVIPIPLRETDEDVALDLQAMIDQCYRNGCYGEEIDYRADPSPPLAPDDAAWADALLREKGLRP